MAHHMYTRSCAIICHAPCVYIYIDKFCIKVVRNYRPYYIERHALLSGARYVQQVRLMAVLSGRDNIHYTLLTFSREALPHKPFECKSSLEHSFLCCRCLAERV
jgi:hypothetical protein